jgi:hypothetical protein
MECLRMKPSLHTTQFTRIARWLRSSLRRRSTAPAGPEIKRSRPPAAFCTHIATTMQWRISGNR